jgi:hypothetical protein
MMEASRKRGRCLCLYSYLGTPGVGKCERRRERRDRSQDAASVRHALRLRGTAATEYRSVRGVRAKANQNVLAWKAKCFASGREADRGRRRWMVVVGGWVLRCRSAFIFFSFLICCCRSWPPLYLGLSPLADKRNRAFV